MSELPGRSACGSCTRVEPGEGLVSLAGESEGIIGSFLQSESDFPSLNSSSLGSLSSACARRVARSAASAVARVCPGSSSLAVSAAVAHAHAPTLHDACSNSWSDTVRVKGPTGTRRVKGGVSGPAEDFRRVSEVEAGVNFRPAGSVRGQVPGSLPRRQPGTGTRQCQGKVWSHLPSTRRFLVSNSCHLDTDWTSGNRWAGRRCVEPNDRGFGC